jgi:DNA adenine methylase
MVPVSPLRYPGGKGKLSDFFVGLVRANDLEGGAYVEAFAGGAAVGVHLLLQGLVSRVVINDLDRSLWAFWKAVLDRTEEFVDATMSTPLTITEWKRQRNLQRDPQSTVFDLGFSTFYLNRTNHSGVLNGGPIGGLGQDGKYKLNARFNRRALVDRVRSIGERSDQIELHNLDAEEFIKCVLPRLPRDDTLVYFDPPYYTKGRNLYMTYYDHEDHRRLSQAIASVPHLWCVSYDDVPEVHAFYRGHKIRRFQLDYSAHCRRKGAEMMVFSDRLRVPGNVRLPSQVNRIDS